MSAKMVETLLALFFGWLMGGAGVGKRKQGGGGGGIAPEHPYPPGDLPAPKPVPPSKAPPQAPTVPKPPANADPPQVPPPSAAVPEVIPPSYKPPGGWVPYLTPWSVGRAKFYLGQPSLLPAGNAIMEVSPTGVTAKFRAESGKQHGDPKLKRAVTAWRMAK